MVRFSGNVKPITEPTSEPASTYNASTMLSKSTVKPHLSSAPTTSKPLLQTTPSVEIPPPSSQPRLPSTIVEVNGHLVGGHLPGLGGVLVSAPIMTPHGIVGGIEGGNPPSQPRGILVSKPILPPGALEKLHESPPSGTTETVQIGNLTFSGVRVVNLSPPATTPKETTPPHEVRGTTHKVGAPPSAPITGSHTGSLGTGETTSPKPILPRPSPIHPPIHHGPIGVPIGGSENPPVKLVSEPILPPGKEFTPPSGSTSSTSHKVGTPPLAPVTGSHTGTHVGSPPSGGEKTPPHEMPTPIEVSPNRPQPVKVVSETVHTPHSEVARTPTNVITHLWIGWRIEPKMEEFIRRFVETFRHGRHPRMGGAPPPGASPSPPGVLPLLGAPLVIISPQGAEQQQEVTV